MESLLKDVKHSIRVLRQSPSFTMTAVELSAGGIELHHRFGTAMVRSQTLYPTELRCILGNFIL